MMFEFSASERRILRELVNWALDQDGDSIEPDYLWFLADEDNPEIADSDRVREVLRKLDLML